MKRRALFDARFDAEDALVFRRLPGKENWLAVLKACPVSRTSCRVGAPHQVWLTRLVDALQGRIHGFNVSVAHVWAEQERLLSKTGQRMPVEDSYIAATARRNGLTIATGNDQDFRRPGLKVFNPFKELS